MARTKLPNRRPSLTVKVPVTLDGGKPVTLLVSIGFADDAMTKPMEVFCASFKVGTAMQTIIMDACILLSRLLQHGDSPKELFETLAQGPSVIGAIAQTVMEVRGDGLSR